MERNEQLSIIYPHNQRLMSGKANDIVIMKTCHAIAKLGHRVKIISGRPARTDPILSYYGLKEIPHFELITVPMLRGTRLSWHAVYNFFCLMKILELKKSGQADIIYLREIKLAKFLLRFRRILGLPVVIEVHDLKIRKFYNTCPDKNTSEEYVFRRVNGIVVLLEIFGHILRETYQITHVPIVKVPLAAEKMPFDRRQNRSNIVGYIGQLYPLQGVDVLIEAMCYLPNARLRVIGGPDKDLIRLKKFAVEKNVHQRIDFYGFVTPQKVPELSREVDILVICALNRGKRRYAAHTKLYEYMAMGKPIVAVDLPSISEDAVDGKEVLLAKPEDPKSLAQKIAEILNNNELANALALNAYKSADTFSWEHRAERLSNYFREQYANFQEMNAV